ncbi:putative monodehydroascorbate reductase (NADH) [Helianthus annuus]|uniref:monodehydroascorbate reductase (NADH) n=1 Tax=Helianthus annuus TaxID=4232 RepID=A0A9K3IMU2_HELAN|nr:putative monodehydroascorbate reductase (NADH) [Helianthus annuus]KAJ0558042.1 putative monodehydroascorbate reductase (NADH) [Helianthus annuus]KAJ0729400.1 putative monodehydroascorbate reductase (NADH) [Helianthus annuus]KAJ0905744.1 putative monodehydroascorbate reductase (NADH) [Helianthus annuus]
MGRAFVYVILGGGVAAGYAALEFTKKGVSHGELCIISEEPFLARKVAPYERPALSKGFLLPEAPARLPAFHTCVGANEERLTPKWYKEHGIELILGTRVKSADVRRKTLLTAAGETISYKYLIIATGARALRLEEFGVSGSDAENVCYLRDLADATRLADVMQTSTGGNAVVIGGGYIGMEVAASLVINKINVSMVFPEPHCMGRLFTPKIASYYEEFYKAKGVNFVKGTVLSSFVFDEDGKVTGVNLKDGTDLPADLVVVGIGIRPNTSLFEGQLTLEKGGIKVNSRLQTSNSSVYAVGDVASFPVKIFGESRRLEHVDAARKSARHAVAAIMEPDTTPEFDYLPFFYSRVFSFSWQFYGDNLGEVIYFGDFSGPSFGAYWVHKGHLVGSFLEGGSKEEYEAIAKVTRLKPAVDDLSELERQGLGFVVALSEKLPVAPVINVGGSMSTVVLEKPLYAWHATAGVVVAASIAAFAYWYGRRRRRW